MISRKTITKTFEFEQVEEVRCDMCNMTIVGKGPGDQFLSFAMLSLSCEQRELILSGEMNEESARENTDLCKNCYQDILKYIYSKGGKAPSFYHGKQEVEALLEEEENKKDVH